MKINSFRKSIRKSYSFLIFFGLIFGGIPSIFIYQDLKIRWEGDLINAEVVKVKTNVNRNDNKTSYTYLPTFRFKYKGETIEKEAISSASTYNYQIGSVKRIYHSEKSDYVAINSPSAYLILIAPIAGFSLFTFGVIAFFDNKKREKEIKKLKEIGIKKPGYFLYFEETGVSKNEVADVYLVLSPKKNFIEIGEKLRYSDIVNGKEARLYAKKDVFDVYIDPANSESYFVDLASAKEEKEK